MKRNQIILAAMSLIVWEAGVAADSGVGPENTIAIPAPPGPYQSSEPYLLPEEGEEGNGPQHYYGAMQFPVPSRQPYFGPGRYWAPSDWQQPEHQRRFATQPMPPWGEPSGGPQDEVTWSRKFDRAEGQR